MVSDMIESLRSTQIAFLIRNAFWVSWGGKNRTKPLVRITFLGTRPLVFPPPAIRFSAETT